jgi:hypothetical protein
MNGIIYVSQNATVPLPTICTILKAWVLQKVRRVCGVEGIRGNAQNCDKDDEDYYSGTFQFSEELSRRILIY